MNVGSVTIGWDRVNCQERNGIIVGYRVVYYPTLSANIMNDQVARTLVGTEEDVRVLSANGLPPRTSYTFEVQAFNTHINMDGPPAFITANTTAPQGKYAMTITLWSTCKENVIFFSRPSFSFG